MARNTITAEVVANSVSPSGRKITTFVLEYPRWIHAELMTHRVFSRNAASSRAIPVATSMALCRANPAFPSYWGRNKPGMQDDGVIPAWKRFIADIAWNRAFQAAYRSTWVLTKLGVHKQFANRLLEPWSHIRTVVTSTDWKNFYDLRLDAAAHADIRSLAVAMRQASDGVFAVRLDPGSWHLPFYFEGYWTPVSQLSGGEWIDAHGIGLLQAQKVSASCCAQVSYRKMDVSLAKANRIYDRLIEARPMHASPFEHQATPIDNPRVKSMKRLSEIGITGINKNGELTSGNFVGWRQWRQVIDQCNRGVLCNTK